VETHDTASGVHDDAGCRDFARLGRVSRAEIGPDSKEKEKSDRRNHDEQSDAAELQVWLLCETKPHDRVEDLQPGNINGFENSVFDFHERLVLRFTGAPRRNAPVCSYESFGSLFPMV
jgi:hypothetical protein